IFVTAFSQYAIEAFDANAAHYMLKPVTKDGLVRAVQKASRNLQSLTQLPPRTESANAAMISVFDGEQYLVLNEADSIRLEADGSYTTIVSDKHGRILASKGLLHFAEKLNSSLFFRCHISHIVNIRQIGKISKGRSGYVTLLNNEVVPVSKSRKAQLHQLMGL
ncbi:MAG: LytTR family DNA-binding domain-containing protein, partial [Bacteroidota bacterium]